MNYLKKLWCDEGELNSYSLRHTPLKRACLPIPPPSHIKYFIEEKRPSKMTSNYTYPKKGLAKSKTKEITSA